MSNTINGIYFPGEKRFNILLLRLHGSYTTTSIIKNSTAVSLYSKLASLIGKIYGQK
jgi:hypothetical protein